MAEASFDAFLQMNIDAEEQSSASSTPLEFDPAISINPRHAEVLKFAQQEQSVNYRRITKGSSYKNSKTLKNVAIKSARTDALQDAIRGQPSRTMQIRRQADAIRYQIKEDVALNPSTPHLWSANTRAVAFGTGAAIQKLLPVDMDEMEAEFARIKEAELEAEMQLVAGRLGSAAKKKKESTKEIKSAAESLEGFGMSITIGDDEEEDENEENAGENEDNPDDPDNPNPNPDSPIPLASAAMQPLAAVTNPNFSQFVAQASGADYEAEVILRRRKKAQYRRKGKVYPRDGVARDCETHEKGEIDETSWVHYKEAVDEGKAANVLGALGKFKKRLTKAKEEGTVGVKSAAENAFAAAHPPPKLAPPPPQEIDWEAAANDMLNMATSEQNEEARKAKKPGRVIRAVPSKPKRWTTQKSFHTDKHAAPGDKIIGANYATMMAYDLFNHEHHGGVNGRVDGHHRHLSPEELMKQDYGSVGDNNMNDSVVSEFDYYLSPHARGTHMVDIGAADTLTELVNGAGTEVKKAISEIAVMKDRYDRELMQLVKTEELAELKRKRVEMKTTHPARIARVRLRHNKERKERRELIIGQRHENEMIIANKLAQHGLIR